MRLSFLAFLGPPQRARLSFLNIEGSFPVSAIGWQPGVITRRNTDARRKRDGELANFYIHYEVDDDEVATVLSLEDYGGDDECSWLLLVARARCAGRCGVRCVRRCVCNGRFLGVPWWGPGPRHRFLAPNLKIFTHHFLMRRFLNARN